MLSFVKSVPETSNMIETCLALYAADGMLPEHNQLLFCNEATTKEGEPLLLSAFSDRLFVPLRRSKHRTEDVRRAYEDAV